MKILLYFLFVSVIVMLMSSCLYDTGEVAVPGMGCDTSYYTREIKPIVALNCASDIGCHASGATNADFTTHAGMLPYLETGDVKHRINADLNDPAYMPQGALLADTTLAKLNDWIDAGYVGCD